MQKSKINLSYLLSTVSVILYIFIPTYITSKKVVEFIFAGITPVIAIAGLVLFIIACKKSNFDKEQKPFFVPSLVTMSLITTAEIIKLISGISLGFVPVLGNGIFRYFEYALVAFSVYNAVVAICISLMKTDK